MYSIEVKKLVERKAYELWESEDCLHGRDMDHWLRAEKEVVGTSEPCGEQQDQSETEPDREERLRVVEAAE